MEILKQGAEAKLFLGSYKDQKCLIKERFEKKYRHPDLDTLLTKERMRAESRAISRCQTAGIKVPRVFHMDLNNRCIYMEYFENSITVKAFINDVLPTIDSEEERKKRLDKLTNKIGTVIGLMHGNNIIHGDLTTSNILLEPKNNDKSFDDYELVMIDFGLSNYGQSAEHKGVDLYVLERALLSTHSAIPTLFPQILDTYKKANDKNCAEVIAKFEEIRARGRKRTMIG